MFVEASGEAVVVVVTPQQGAVERVNLKRMLQEAVEAENEEGIPPMSFTVRQVATNQAAYRILRSAALPSLLQRNHIITARTFVCATCPHTEKKTYTAPGSVCKRSSPKPPPSL